MTAIIIIIALVVVIGGYFVSTQRSLVGLDELCKNAMSQIQVQLNSRWDALMNLAKMAAQYSKHESETLINVIRQRRGEDVSTAEDVSAQQGALQQVMGRLIAIGEAYPDLKASDLFRETMEGVNKYEENVRMARMIYNDTATKMNRAVRQWPSSIVASLLHFDERKYLEVDSAEKTQAPDLNDAFGK